MRTLVVGIGSTILGDDGIGVWAVRRLQSRLAGTGVDLVELGTAGLTLLDCVEGYDRLILIDAIVTGAPAGTLHELTGDDVASSAHLGAGHEADLPTTLALGHRLSKHMPKDVAVLAVEASELHRFSERLSPEVEAAFPRLIEKIEALLAEPDFT